MVNTTWKSLMKATQEKLTNINDENEDKIYYLSEIKSNK